MDGVTALLTDELLHMTSLQVGSATSLLQFALLPIAKVLVLCGFGLAMATPYINILTAPSRRVLSKLVFSLFLPCLIFTQLGTAISFQKIFLW
jgi:predicted permease